MAHLGDQVRDLEQSGLGVQARRTVWLTEDPEQTLQLADGLPRLGLDREQGLLRLLWVPVDRHSCGGGLYPHEAHPVRDDVVQLAGDAGPLLGQHLRGPRAALGFHPVHVLGGLIHAALPGAHQVADHPYPDDDEQSEQDLAAGPFLGNPGDEHRLDSEDSRQPESAPTSYPVRGGRVVDDQQRQQTREQ